jgi:hypothetical protein
MMLTPSINDARAIGISIPRIFGSKRMMRTSLSVGEIAAVLVDDLVSLISRLSCSPFKVSGVTAAAGDVISAGSSGLHRTRVSLNIIVP